MMLSSAAAAAVTTTTAASGAGSSATSTVAATATKTASRWLNSKAGMVIESSAYHLTPYHPATTVMARRSIFSPSINHHYLPSNNNSSMLPSVRWEKNLSRLYARRIMEIAIASLATQKFLARSQCEQQQDAIVVTKPSDWENWSRKDWTDDLLYSMGSTKLQRFWTAMCRLTNLAVLVAPMTVLVPLSYLHPRISELTWSYALWGVEHAGPSFIKLTQWATTRQDLFSPEFCWRFGKLRDDTRGHSWKETQKILKQDLGIHCYGDDGDNAMQSSYIDLEKQPIGSGCIAQVYKGKLLKDIGQTPAGTEIALKIQHPNIWHNVCADFYIMGKVSKWLEAIPYLNLKYLSLQDTVRQFRDIMLPQLNLTLEANHLRRFNRDFASNDRVSFPSPIKELTTKRVLTETFLHGRPIMEYVNRDEATRVDIANLGLQTTLQMIFVYDFLHGDLHPGNILVEEDDGVGNKLHLLDCGLVVEMGPEQHVNLVKILGAFTRRKGRQAAQLMVDTSSNCQASYVDVDLFVNGIEQIVKDDENNNFIEKVGDYITDICWLACKHKVKLEASFINAALAVEIMEGIASALNPNIVVTKVALPMVVQAEMMHRLPKFSLW